MTATVQRWSGSFPKDTLAELDYWHDWSAWLASGETIITSTWTVPAGLTDMATPGISGGRTFVWLSGGTVDTAYLVTNEIETSAGRVDRRTIRILVGLR